MMSSVSTKRRNRTGACAFLERLFRDRITDFLLLILRKRHPSWGFTSSREVHFHFSVFRLTNSPIPTSISTLSGDAGPPRFASGYLRPQRPYTGFAAWKGSSCLASFVRWSTTLLYRWLSMVFA